MKITTKNVAGSKLIGVTCVLVTIMVGYLLITKQNIINLQGMILAVMAVVGVFIIGVIMIIMPNIELNTNPFVD